MEALRRARHVGWDVAAGPTSVGTPPAFPKMGTHCRGNYQRAAPLAAFPLVLLWEEIKLWGQGGETCERPSALGRGHFCPSICSGADRTEPSLGPVCTRRPFKFVHGLTVLPFARMGIVILSGQPRTPPPPPLILNVDFRVVFAQMGKKDFWAAFDIAVGFPRHLNSWNVAKRYSTKKSPSYFSEMQAFVISCQILVNCTRNFEGQTSNPIISTRRQRKSRVITGFSE